jgi:penicillin amidase
MPTPRAKVLAGIASVLLLTALALVLFVTYQVRKSFPQSSGTAVCAPLAAPVRVTRDAYGVPFIVAGSEREMIIAQGYVHAQDRFWQMDMARRIASGRLSEILGSEALPFDRMFRIAGLRRSAERIAEGLPADSREFLSWYAEGVNAYLESARGKLPVEFDLLRYDPEPWTITDCLLTGRLLAWELNLAWWTDLTMGAIAERVGLQRAVELVPGAPGEGARAPAPGLLQGFGQITESLRRIGGDMLLLRGGGSFAAGSNAWAVAPVRSTSGAAVLANDTHLRLTLPGQWHEIHLRCPQYGVGGMSIPGSPGVVAGRNDSIAWGVTNLMADDADFYVEQIDSTGTLFLRDGKWVPLAIRTELIPVRGESTAVCTVRETANGPIVTDVAMPLRRGAAPYVASMRWLGNEFDDQVAAIRRINRAGNWEAFREGVSHFAIPGQNFVYADVRGHIGYQAGARVPIRPGKQSPLLPLPGWESATGWKGTVPFREMPVLYDPPEGFIASANNAPRSGPRSPYISTLWEPESRHRRLREVLGRKGEAFSVADFQRLQNDTYSHYAREMVPYIFTAFADTALCTENDRALLEYLRNWHYYFAQEDIATSIFQAFLVRLLKNTVEDELGEELFHDWVMLTNVPVRVLERLLAQDNSIWFDDVRTAEVEETRDDIVRKSLRDAEADLRSRIGNDRKEWRWGTLHTVTLTHPFGLRKPLDRIFNLGPYPTGGATTALVSGEYSFNAPFAVTVGPSFRQIFDLGSPVEVRSILPAGESGQLFHPHYDDQVRLWLNGGYRLSRRDGTGGGEVLVLEPAR